MLLYPLANTMGVSRLIKRSNIHTYLSNKDLVKQLGYINGKFTKGSSSAENTFDVINPANGDVLAQLPRMNGQDVKDASSAANDAFKTWKHTTSIERSKILKKMGNLMGKYIDDLATIITLEAGKPLAEAKGEIIYAQSFYDFYAEEATRVHGEILQSPIKGRRLLTMKQPIGPAGLITPWNFPSAMITRKVCNFTQIFLLYTHMKDLLAPSLDGTRSSCRLYSCHQAIRRNPSICTSFVCYCRRGWSASWGN